MHSSQIRLNTTDFMISFRGIALEIRSVTKSKHIQGCIHNFCFLPAWWLWREACTRSHPELGRENSQRRWYFVLRHGRVGRRQACKKQKFLFIILIVAVQAPRRLRSRLVASPRQSLVPQIAIAVRGQFHRQSLCMDAGPRRTPRQGQRPPGASPKAKETDVSAGD